MAEKSETPTPAPESATPPACAALISEPGAAEWIEVEAPEGHTIADAMPGARVFQIEVDDPDGLIVAGDTLGLAEVLAGPKEPSNG